MIAYHGYQRWWIWAVTFPTAYHKSQKSQRNDWLYIFRDQLTRIAELPILSVTCCMIVSCFDAWFGMNLIVIVIMLMLPKQLQIGMQQTQILILFNYTCHLETRSSHYLSLSLSWPSINSLYRIMMHLLMTNHSKEFQLMQH